MAQVKVERLRLDRKGIAALLKSAEFRKRTTEAARSVASKVGDGAKVDEYTTDRTAAAVSVPAYDQARNGALTRAAAAAGLEVRAR